MISLERGVVTEKIRATLELRPEVLEAYLFGSFARGEAGPTSDIDVAVFLDDALDASARGLLVAELLRTRLDDFVELPRRIDAQL